MPEHVPRPVPVLGVPVHPLTVAELHGHIQATVEADQHYLLLNVNIHALNLAYRHEWLRDFLRSARIVFCDGAGVILGARLLGYRIPERITYADWMWELAHFSADRSYRLFFLGGRDGVAERAAGQLRDRFPGLAIVGCHHGYFDKTPGSRENEAVLAAINATRPHILVVGFGMPVQERWLLDNWDRVDANVALTGGAVFDYVSGDLRRPPRLLRGLGMEWLGRLFIEPRRLASRYVLGNPLFLWRVIRQRVQKSQGPSRLSR
jgi:N-acetylglucosaminyldiphosphoundecaprenol N-acetyl-beta-D-mannosaminyltransferase